MAQAISSGPFSAIGDTLTPLLAALRMVWVISRHYSDDERMSSLLQRVAFAIAERCVDAVDLKVRIEGRAAVMRDSPGGAHPGRASGMCRASFHTTLRVLPRTPYFTRAAAHRIIYI